MATFDSSGVGSDVSPSYPPKLKIENNLIKVALGDGYEQRLQKGINATRRTFTLSFLNRTNTVTTNILNFLADANKGNNGQKAFDWSPPFGATGKWTCENPVVTIVSNDLNNIDLEFREVFEP
jgi:phage-related protein